MRIAVLMYQFPVLSETFILRQITGLLDAGHDVRIFAECASDQPEHHPHVDRYRLLDRTRYLNLPLASGRYEIPVSPLWGDAWPDGQRVSNTRRVLRCMPKVVRCFAAHPHLTHQVLSKRHYGYQAASLSALYRLSELSSEQPNFDVIHAHFGPVGMSFRFARKLWRAPLVVSFHGYDFSTWPRRFGSHAYQPLFEEADLITVPTKNAGDTLRSLGCPQRLLRRLEYGIDLGEFRFRVRTPPTTRPIRVLTVGRLVEKKGIELSIRAVAQLLREGYDLHYEIIGDGPRCNTASRTEQLLLGRS